MYCAKLIQAATYNPLNPPNRIASMRCSPVVAVGHRSCSGRANIHKDAKGTQTLQGSNQGGRKW